MANKVILSTERLTLREAKLSDKHFFYKLLNTPKWLKYIRDRGIKTLENAEAYIKEPSTNEELLFYSRESEKE